ncbi:CHAT domain-containing protein [Amycolatopsis sp. MEPSY49]|uniref:CHAT domain-containing protein n=1 Tax=Amycolatopsis sp. MEPSY49 TaxID=3151600 RepID=UPI003EF4D8BB
MTTEQALEAVDLAYTAPPRACRLARLALAGADGDREPVAVAERALGMAHTALGDLAKAEQHLLTAIETADTADLPVRAAEARGSMAYLRSLTGRFDDALAQISRAEPALHGRSLARLRMLRALVLTEAGRFDEAAEGYADALDVLRRAGGDAVLEGDIRNNRSLVHVHRWDWRAAQEDLDRAEALYTASGHLGKTATVHHNRGLAAVARGDLPAALAAFDEAADQYRSSGRDPGLLPIERAETLLSALLVKDARQAAEVAVERFAGQRNAVDLVQARLLLARAALLDGDLAVAAEQAEKARRSAIGQRRPGWAALGGYLALRARWEGGQRGEATIRAGRRSAVALARAGWVVEALDARLIVARTALEAGRLAVARRELAHPAFAHRGRPAEQQARAWHARALLRLSEGDRAGAESAILAGIRVLERFRAGLGATELRVHAAGHAGELARLGLRLAMAAGDPESVLTWLERWRAGTLLLRPARPVDDAELGQRLAELRQVVAGLAAAAERGGDTATLVRRQAALESAIRRRSHRVNGELGAQAGALGPVSGLRAELGSSALVEYVAADGELHAVVVRGDRVRLHRLGPVAGIEHELTALRFGLRRLAYGTGSAAVPGLVVRTAAALDRSLVEPLLPDVGDRPLIVVPTGFLHAMPWAVLPSCAGRPVSVAPSAALWLRARTAVAGSTGARVFASGPGLPHSVAEVATLAGRYRGARRFTGRNATVASVTAALDGAELAHIAAHGRFRADNPLFSALQLVDGPLTVYDLERLTRPPRHVILSACESGLPVVRPGDELLGLAAALLAMGSTSLVASVVPVPDATSRPLMLRLHRHLRAGAAPATALAKAQQDFADPAAVAGFLCYGAG